MTGLGLDTTKTPNLPLLSLLIQNFASQVKLSGISVLYHDHGLNYFIFLLVMYIGSSISPPGITSQLIVLTGTVHHLNQAIEVTASYFMYFFTFM